MKLEKTTKIIRVHRPIPSNFIIIPLTNDAKALHRLNNKITIKNADVFSVWIL